MARKRRKLPNGIGSITKLGKTKAGKNRLSPYMARLPAYYDIEGKEIRKVIGCFRTYNEAQEALLNYNGLDNKADKLIDIYNAYKQSKDFRDLTRKTQVKYDTAFSHFEQLHTQKIININRYQLQKVIDNKVEEGYYTVENGKEVHKNYSKATIRQLKTTIVKVFEFAIDNNMLKINIAKGLKVKGEKENTTKGKDLFKPSEIRIMYSLREKIPFLNHLIVLCFTGLRTGEYRGLKTENINFEDNVIENFGIKTEAGMDRKVIILPNIKPILIQLVKESNTGYIYEKDRKHVSENTFYKEYYQALKQAGLKRRKPYNGRYTFATNMYRSKVDKKAITAQMGHTNFNITDKYYILNDKEYLAAEMKKMQ